MARAYRISPRAARLRARLANAALRGDDAEGERLRAELAEAVFESRLHHLIADAPPLSVEQTARCVAELLRITRAGGDSDAKDEGMLADV